MEVHHLELHVDAFGLVAQRSLLAGQPLQLAGPGGARRRAFAQLRDQVEAALRELEMADETDSFIKALKAECYKKLKRSDEAKELRESVLTDPTINFFDAAGTFARLHAKEM